MLLESRAGPKCKALSPAKTGTESREGRARRSISPRRRFHSCAGDMVGRPLRLTAGARNGVRALPYASRNVRSEGTVGLILSNIINKAIPGDREEPLMNFTKGEILKELLRLIASV